MPYARLWARAVERARKTQQPTLLFEVRTYRFMGHSMSDAVSGTYRPKSELEEYMKRDPITLLRTKMEEAGTLTEEQLQKMDTEIKAVVQDAWDFADASLGASTRGALRRRLRRHNYLNDGTTGLHLSSAVLSSCPPVIHTLGTMPVITYRDALGAAIWQQMQRDDRVFLMGEEVAVYQGAYKVSKGFLQEFGEMRVVDTPITELGFAGVGVGAAMVGLRPVIEFMTWNFALLALDQVVNAAAKMLYMSGGQFKIPIVFRGPNGAALQLSAQHSQAWESWLAHIPGLKVIAPGTPYDAKGLLKSAIRDDNPVCFLEGEMLYNTKGEVPDEEYTIPIGKADLKREGDHCSIITHGKMVLVAMQAADQLAKEGIRIDVVDLRTIRPMDVEAIAASVNKTNRAVVLEEGWEVCVSVRRSSITSSDGLLRQP